MPIEFKNLTKQKKPSIPWEKIKERLLGKKYELSVVFAGNALMKKLNKEHRKKDKAANVLSFSLSKKEGEIFINLSQSKDRKTILHMFIHSLLHLKGFEHSDKMDNKEEKLIKLIWQEI